MKKLKHWFFYLLYLFICVEIISTVCLFSPPINARLFNTDTGSGWRIRYIYNAFKARLTPGAASHKKSYPFDRYDRTKGWDLKPGLKDLKVFEDKTLNSNSEGVRGNREYSNPKKRGTKRILVIGDSFTFGEGVSDNETYPSYLQGLFPEYVEVINLGIHGYGHDQMLIKLEELGRRYQPDLVVLGFFAEDMERNLLDFRDYAKPQYVLKEGELRLTHVPVPTVRELLIGEFFRLHSYDIFEIARTKIKEKTGRIKKEKKAITAALLTEIHREATALDSKFMILYLPSVFEIFDGKKKGGEHFAARYAQHEDIPFCDPKEALLENLKRGKGYERAGGNHLGPSVNRDIAQALYHCIEEAHLLGEPGQ